MESTFTAIYETAAWGDNRHPSYKGSSGGGSALSYNQGTYVPFLRKFLTDHSIQSVADLGCGDFQCGRAIYDGLNIQYIGYDVYAPLVQYNSSTYSAEAQYRFVHLDFAHEIEKIQPADVYILKDVLQHWPLEAIYKFLDTLVQQKRCKYILICNCCHTPTDDSDIQAGEWRSLHSAHLPLKKYSPRQLYTYHTKEVCVVEPALIQPEGGEGNKSLVQEKE